MAKARRKVVRKVQKANDDDAPEKSFTIESAFEDLISVFEEKENEARHNGKAYRHYFSMRVRLQQLYQLHSRSER